MMKLKIKNKRIKIVELNTFWERFKGLKFVLEPIDYGVRFPHKRFSTTNFLCQKIDVILTDKDDTILYLYEKFGSEKYILPKRKVYYTYFLPVGIAQMLKIGEKLEIVDKVEEENIDKEKENKKNDVNTDTKNKKKKNNNRKKKKS